MPKLKTYSKKPIQNNNSRPPASKTISAHHSSEQYSNQNSATQLLHLQQTVGNQAVMRMLGKTPVSAIQREPKRTENRILNEASNTGFTDEHADDLIEKMDKDQDFKHARAIAQQIETESEQLVKALPPLQETAVRKAIKDYVSSSTAIQTDARNNPNAPGQGVQALDSALQLIRQQVANNGGSNERIVYRSITYDTPNDIPYGQMAGGYQIAVGDYVGDLGFLSTSEHRQFVLGKEQTGTINGLLKIAIYSKSGVPVAIEIPTISYTNTNQKALYDMNEDKKNKLTQVWNKAFGAGSQAGQAEILFPRNTVFEVKKIQPDGNKVSVVLEEFVGVRPNPVKNMKYGQPI